MKKYRLMHHAHPHALPAAVGLGLALSAVPQPATAGSVAEAFQSSADGRTLVPLSAPAVRHADPAATPRSNPASQVDATATRPAHDASPAVTALILPASGEVLIGPPEPDEVTGDEQGLQTKTAPPPAQPYASDQPTPVQALFPAGQVERTTSNPPQVVDFLDTLRRDSPIYQLAFGPARHDATQPLAPDPEHPGPVQLILPPDA